MTWQPDPLRRFSLRWFDGTTPTGWVRNQGQAAVRDPSMPGRPPPVYQRPIHDPMGQPQSYDLRQGMQGADAAALAARGATVGYRMAKGTIKASWRMTKFLAK